MSLGIARFAVFDDIPGLMHAVFTRHGGVSAAPFATLNLALGVPDDPEAVHENRRRALAALAWPAGQVVSTWQVHGTDVLHAQAPSRAGEPQPKVDILVSATPGLALFMRFADCTPVLLVDPARRALALAHAGWRGTVAGAAARAVAALVQHFGSRPEELRAAIGPAIGPCCYAVGADVIAPARARFGDDPEVLVAQGAGRVHFNLWEANRRQLADAGVAAIEVAAECTACHRADYFSHRAECGRTGRFGVYLGWRD